MAVADWTKTDGLTITLKDDYVKEGNYAAEFAIERYYDYGVAVHNKTLNDKPVSGGVKTYFLERGDTIQEPLIVFKYQDDANFLAVRLTSNDPVIVFDVVNNDIQNVRSGSVIFEPEADKWYIAEVICNDTEKTVTVRIYDENGNKILEDTIDIGTSPFIGNGGGIGIGVYNPEANYTPTNTIYYDLTKIYY